MSPDRYQQIMSIFKTHTTTGYRRVDRHVRIGCRCGWFSGRLNGEDSRSASLSHRRHVARVLAEELP